MAIVYTALDSTRKQIRLTHLAPASQLEDEIVCNFSTISVEEGWEDKGAFEHEEELEYEALSYVWGDENDKCSIKVGESSVLVTKNLFLALKHLRHKDKIRILWIDALCINQADIPEREQQVAFMGLIYHRAFSVIVWLGEAWIGSDLAMDVIQQVGQDMNRHLDSSLSPSIDVDGVGLESGDLREYLIMFSKLPWWERVWTIQEFVLARRAVLQCGDRLLDGGLLSKFNENLVRHGEGCCSHLPLFRIGDESGRSISDLLYNIQILEFARAPRDTINFLLLLLRFRQRLSANPSDRLFGILSLAPSFISRIIQPDYTNATEHVFEAATIAIIKNCGNLEVLSHLFGERNLDLPSFVPDWTGSVPPSMLPFYLRRLTLLELYNASGGVPAEINIVGKGQLVARGILLDILDENTAKGRFQDFQELVLGDGGAEKEYTFSGESMGIAFWHTMCGSIEYYTKDSILYSHRIGTLTDISNYERWQAWAERQQGWRPKTPFVGEIGDVKFVNQAISSNMAGRKIGRTEKGYFGAVPKESKKGDIIVVLAGGPVPYILRPQIDGTGEEEQTRQTRYTILGDCYIHGIMDGEVLTMPEYEREWEDLTLV